MSVKELIEFLETLDPKLKVKCNQYDGYDYYYEELRASDIEVKSDKVNIGE